MNCLNRKRTNTMLYLFKGILFLTIFIIPISFFILNKDLCIDIISIIIISFIYLLTSLFLIVALKYLIKFIKVLIKFLLGSDCKKGVEHSNNNLLDDGIYEDYPSVKTKALETLIDGYKLKSFLSIGPIGDWGSGKSSYLNKLSKQLSDKYIVICINVWELGNQSNIINELEKELDNEIFKNNFLVWIILTIKKIIVKSYFQILNKYYSINKSIIDISLTPTIKDSKNKFSKVLQQAFDGKKLIIMLDELDRINDKKEIYNIFNTIRYLTSFDNTITITAVDLNQLASKIDNIEYVHKIFYTKYFIPKHTKNDMNNFLKEKLDLLMQDSSQLLNKKYENKSIPEIINNYREIKNSFNDTLLLKQSLENIYKKDDWTHFINIEFIFILNLIKAINFNVFNKIYQMENIDYTEKEILNFEKNKFKEYFDSIKSNESNKNTKMKQILKEAYAKNIEILENILKSFVNNYDINQCFYLYKYHQIEDFLSTNSEYKDFIKDKKKIQIKYDSLRTNDYKKQFFIFLIKHCYEKKELIPNVIEIIFDNKIEDEEILKHLVINDGNNSTLITTDSKQYILKLKDNRKIFIKIIELILTKLDANKAEMMERKKLFENNLVIELFQSLEKKDQEEILKNNSLHNIPDKLQLELKGIVNGK